MGEVKRVQALAKLLHDLAHPNEDHLGAGKIYVTLAERIAYVLRDGDAGGFYQWLADHRGESVPAETGRTPLAVDVAEALGELECLTDCRCDPAWTDRNMHAPECASDYRSDVNVLRAALTAPATP